MLKLSYQTSLFGPIDLDYAQAVIRVGRCEDNDLVLRHHSVQPHHCLLLFRGEKLLCLPPDQPVGAEIDLRKIAGREYSAGDVLKIGDIEFNLAHSPNTVVLPVVENEPSRPEHFSADSGDVGAGPNRYWCSRCRVFVLETNVKLVGLVGHAKRKLCPKCSNLLEPEAKPEPLNSQPAPATRRSRFPWGSKAASG